MNIKDFPIICAAIDRALETVGEKEQVNVAIDGMCGSGKTTLGEALAEKYECNLLHMDDFFLRPEQRTLKRYEEPGGNVDYERFRAEVLKHLADEEGFIYRRFDCHTMKLEEPYPLSRQRLNIIEGAYILCSRRACLNLLLPVGFIRSPMITGLGPISTA